MNIPLSFIFPNWVKQEREVLTELEGKDFGGRWGYF